MVPPNGEQDAVSPRLCAMLQTQASDEGIDDVFSRCPLYCGRAGSDVIGCRRPTDGVFVCMLQTWVMLTFFLTLKMILLTMGLNTAFYFYSIMFYFIKKKLVYKYLTDTDVLRC